jgi:hypothetical protein
MDLVYQTSPTAVFCVSADRLYLADTAGEITHSFDGGLTWSRVSTGYNFTIFDILFLDPMVGYAVGSGGTIVRTEDGGLSWVRLASGTTKYLKRICFPNPDTGFIMGEGSLILRTGNGGGWPVRVQSDNYEGKSMLSVSPNPISSNARIELTLAAKETIEVRLNDFSGRQLRIVYRGEVAAGSTTIPFDVTELNNGIYLISLRTHNQVITKKAVICR